MYKKIKKDTKWSILHHGKFNTNNIKNELLSYNEEWFLDTSRQELGSVHIKTQMYRVCQTDYNWKPGTPIETTYHNSLKNDDSKKELELIFNELEAYYSGKIIRCEFIKMLPQSEILKHVDGGALLAYSRRCHIPITTNPNITFTVMNNTIHMIESNWYEINNQMPHSVSNPTNTERIHLIIDILPDEMLQLDKIGE
jgi:hypothetical protein